MQITSTHIVPSIADEASGPSYSVVRLCQALGEAGCDTRLATLEPKPTGRDLSFAKYFPYGWGPKRLGISPGMENWLRQEVIAGQIDILHNHSLWMMPNVYPGRAVRGTFCKLIVSPRGTLSATALERTSLLKMLFKPVLYYPAVRNAAAFHATSNQEYLDIRAQGLTQPIAVIPNGVDIPPNSNSNSGTTRKLLYLGRLHPIKGIENLLKAWGVVQTKYTNWQLEIAGPGDVAYVKELKKTFIELGLERCIFSGPVYGKDKPQTYRKADLYILPTHSENFGMTVAEALAAGTPAIVTKGAPWQGLERVDAGWWIDIGVDPLVAALQQALSLSPDALANKGCNGREWMIRDFSWDVIGKDMLIFYEWLLNGGEKPDFVYID